MEVKVPVVWPLFHACASPFELFVPTDVEVYLKVLISQNQHVPPTEDWNRMMALKIL